jgi:hypothetical protein
MNKTQSALERVIIELDSWCDNWTPTSYNDPRISLRQIADRARDVLDPRKKMTDFQPKPQTPEQVDQGLRDAFIQAKEDGVFDWGVKLHQPKYSNWKCYLFGNRPGGNGIMYVPSEGRVPNRFVRFMMRICFDCLWVKDT